MENIFSQHVWPMLDGVSLKDSCVLSLDLGKLPVLELQVKFKYSWKLKKNHMSHTGVSRCELKTVSPILRQAALNHMKDSDCFDLYQNANLDTTDDMQCFGTRYVLGFLNFLYGKHISYTYSYQTGISKTVGTTTSRCL